MATPKKSLILAFGVFPMFLSLVVVWSCAASNVESLEAATSSDQPDTVASAAEVEQRNENSGTIQDTIDVIESLSAWHFDRGNLDKNHPRYGQIVESHLDALENYLEQGLSLVDTEIVIQIKNEPSSEHGGVATERQVNGDGSTTITYYNSDL